MKNELKLLKKENMLRSSCLSTKSLSALQKWISYAKSSDINPYDFQLCYKELIGIALQKDLEGSNLEEFFGENMQSVTEDILQSCPKKSLKDYLLFDFRNIIGCLSISLTIMYFVCGTLWKEITLASFLGTIIGFGIWFIYLRFITGDKHRNSFFTPKLNQKLLRTFSVYFMFICIFMLTTYSIKETLSFVSLHIPNIFFCVILGVLWLIITILQNKYIKKISSQKRWIE